MAALFLRSRTNPQYNRDVLAQGLASINVQYDHVAELGRLRGRQRDVAPDVTGRTRASTITPITP
jgi:hypothetical protein